jgi:signal transduction histidine kinase
MPSQGRLSPSDGVRTAKQGLVRRLVARVGRPRETIVVIAAIFSLLCHAALLIIYDAAGGRPGAAFMHELFFCIAASAVISLGVCLVESPLVFTAMHAFRFLAIGVATRILSGAEMAAELLLLVPYLLEGCLYAGVRVGTVFGGFSVAAVALADLLIPSAIPFARRCLQTGILVVMGGVATGLSALVVFYRERTVEQGRRIAGLTATVRNLFDMGLAFQSYASRAGSDSATRERNRITRELHDTVGHALTSVMMSMDAARVLADSKPSELPQLLRTTRNLADDALRETRKTLYRLRSMDDSPIKGLPEIAQLGRTFEGATGVKVELHYGNLPFSLGAQIDSAIYRLAQEGFTNAFRHGSATRIRLVMCQEESEIRVCLWDNGRGAAVIEEGIGLKGMRERFTALGGRVEAVSINGGFELRAVIPYRPL